MINVSVTYPVSPGKTLDLDCYTTKHTDLVINRLTPLGMKAFVIEVPNRGDDDVLSFLVRATLTFESIETFEAAMAEAGAELGADAAKCSDIEPTIEVFDLKVFYPLGVGSEDIA